MATTNSVEVEPLALRPRQIAAALNCSDDMVTRLLANGELKGFKVGAARFVSADELRDFIRRREAAGS